MKYCSNPSCFRKENHDDRMSCLNCGRPLSSARMESGDHDDGASPIVDFVAEASDTVLDIIVDGIDIG